MRLVTLRSRRGLDRRAVRPALVAPATVVALLLTVAASLAGQQTAPSAADLEFFELKVRPVLAESCYSCHSSEKQFATLRLDSRAHILTGGKSGPAVVPGDAEASLLIQAVKGEALQMPLGGELSPDKIADLEEWVRRGAPWPPETAQKSEGEDRYAELVREHWAFQPVVSTAPPKISSSFTPEHPIDRFIVAALEAKGLRPAAPASRDTLIRRLYSVLTGLPPTAEEVRAFAADRSPDAYAKLVNRLLASPAFGEHWARHWLDLVRYAETRGYEWNYEVVGAWRYRDYIVRAFNADVPYDQLVREHIAGDLLEHPRINTDQHLNESIIGTAFYRLGEAGHDDCVLFREIALDVVDNEIDVLSKTFQGLTVACARCHDHKLDPIPSTDYYGLYSILNSSRVATHTIDTPEANAPVVAELSELKPRIRAELAAVWSAQAADVADYILAALPSGPRAAGLDAKRLAAWREILCPDNRDFSDPAFPLIELSRTSLKDADVMAASAKLAEQLRTEAAERAVFNAGNFEPFGDFRGGIPDGWEAEGLGLSGKASPSGEFSVASEGDRAIRGVYPAGVYTHGVSARLNGALRSPKLPPGPKKLSLRGMGGSLGAWRTVIDNCAIGEGYSFLEGRTPSWVTVDVSEKWDRLPVFLELVTRWDNPRIPDRPGRIKDSYSPLLDAPESFFGISEAVLHEGDETPKEELGHLLQLFERGPVKDREELAQRYESVIAAAIGRWQAGKATDDDVRWLDWLLSHELLPNDVGASEELASLVAAYRETEVRLSPPRVVDGLEDAGSGKDFPLLIAGDAKSFGKPAPRRFLERLFGEEPLTKSGSGRRELAELIASEDNPLTARVMVNRVWHYLFGRGIVDSVDNFGSLGDRPSHPKLLDFLAARFMERGWSIKDLIRFIVTSETFQQSGEASEQALEQDPENTLLHHYPLRRLTAEELRDALLAVAGELRAEAFGPSVDPYRRQPKDYRRLFSGPLLGDGRRSLYLKVTRMEGPGFLEAFDFPIPSTTRGARDVTTVPAQSLALLNDPFVVTIAERCAEKLRTGETIPTDERIERLYRMILARDPSPEEVATFEGLAERLEAIGPSRAGDAAVWTDLAHVLLNTKEFLYVE